MLLTRHNPKYGRIGFYVVVMLNALVLTSLSCSLVRKQNPEEIVAQRAQARWDALVKGDLQKAYGYLSPGYRQIKDFERYKRGIFGVGIWQNAKVDKVVCEQTDVCDVTVLVTSKLVLPRVGTPMESTTPVYERWIKDDNEWWFVQK